MPEPFQRNIDSFRILNPDWQTLIWNEENSQDLLDFAWAERVFPRKAGVSNALRLKILQRYGGAYFDVDFLCRLPVDGLIQGSACAAMQDEKRVCNAFLYASEPNHPWIDWQVRNMNRYEGHNPEWGPYLATAAPRELVTLIPPHLVYPYRFDDPPEKRVPHPETIAEHQWKGSWL